MGKGAEAFVTALPTAHALRRLDERHQVFCERLDDPMMMGDAKFHFSAKDSLCSRDFQARAGSKVLEGYRPPFDATPVHRLREAGGLLIGKTNMDEFGFGSFLRDRHTS